MDLKRYNSNYIKNSKKPEYVERVVKELLDEEINKKPYDFWFRFVGEEYPETNHKFLNLPGIFKQIESTNVFTKEGKSLQMDLVESILPDGKNVKYAAITNMEHQARKLSPSKIEDIFFYSIFLIGKFKQPCYSYVITNVCSSEKKLCSQFTYTNDNAISISSNGRKVIKPKYEFCENSFSIKK